MRIKNSLAKGESAETAGRGSLAWLLCQAIRQRDEKAALDCLANGADPETIDSMGKYPLHLAAVSGMPSICQALIDKGAGMFALDYLGCQPAHLAAESDDADCMDVFLDNGWPIDTLDECGASALSMAAGLGMASMSSHLLRRGAAPNAGSDSAGAAAWQALSRLSGPSDEPVRAGILRELLRCGADPSWEDESGCSLLMMACRQESLALAEILIEGGADVHARSRRGLANCALLVAVGSDNESLLDLLLDNGADPSSALENKFVKLGTRLASKLEAAAMMKVAGSNGAVVQGLSARRL